MSKMFNVLLIRTKNNFYIGQAETSELASGNRYVGGISAQKLIPLPSHDVSCILLNYAGTCADICIKFTSESVPIY